MFELAICGFHSVESPHFVINRPEGSPEYLFLFFDTPVMMMLSGEMQQVEANHFVLFQPHFPQYYCHPEFGFTNDWFHFTAQDSLWLSEHCHIPFNTPLHISNWEFIPAFIQQLERASLLRDAYTTEIIQAMITQFFLLLGRALRHQQDLTIHPYMALQRHAFTQFRTRMLLSIRSPWTVDQMAEELKLSRSRFSILYKSFFNISPKEDLIRERLIMAKYFLESSELSVGEIGEKVGFESVFHFSKQFKKATGLPPSRLRMKS